MHYFLQSDGTPDVDMCSEAPEPSNLGLGNGLQSNTASSVPVGVSLFCPGAYVLWVGNKIYARNSAVRTCVACILPLGLWEYAF